jgi:hypothetical protein
MFIYPLVLCRSLMTEPELAYPPGIYQSIFYTALCLHPTHIYVGFACGMTSCALMGVALYATSLNYWRHPVMSSRRRTIDTVVAKTSIAYHIYLSVYTTNRSLTTLPLLTGSGLYVASFYLYQKKYVKSAAVCHCLLHVLVSIGASMIYKDYYDARAVTHANSLLQLCNS